MKKPNAKRNNRQHKKLHSGEWRQWKFFVTFQYECSLDSGFMNRLLDDLYDIAEKHRCYMYGFFEDGNGKLTFTNNGKLMQGIEAQKEMAKRLVGSGLSVKVGFDDGGVKI